MFGDRLLSASKSFKDLGGSVREKNANDHRVILEFGTYVTSMKPHAVTMILIVFKCIAFQRENPFTHL